MSLDRQHSSEEAKLLDRALALQQQYESDPLVGKREFTGVRIGFESRPPSAFALSAHVQTENAGEEHEISKLLYVPHKDEIDGGAEEITAKLWDILSHGDLCRIVQQEAEKCLQKAENQEAIDECEALLFASMMRLLSFHKGADYREHFDTMHGSLSIGGKIARAAFETLKGLEHFPQR